MGAEGPKPWTAREFPITVLAEEYLGNPHLFHWAWRRGVKAVLGWWGHALFWLGVGIRISPGEGNCITNNILFDTSAPHAGEMRDPGELGRLLPYCPCGRGEDRDALHFWGWRVGPELFLPLTLPGRRGEPVPLRRQWPQLPRCYCQVSWLLTTWLNSLGDDRAHWVFGVPGFLGSGILQLCVCFNFI